jgi:hypothetical protein
MNGNNNYCGDLTVAAAGELEDLDYDALMEELNSDPQYVADMEERRQEALCYQMNNEDAF